jgi:hypothetical protein
MKKWQGAFALSANGGVWLDVHFKNIYDYTHKYVFPDTAMLIPILFPSFYPFRKEMGGVNILY